MSEYGLDDIPDLPVDQNQHDHLFFPMVYAAPRSGRRGILRHVFSANDQRVAVRRDVALPVAADERAVFTLDLNVLGIGDLRIVDASMTPNALGGTTSSPSIMIGEHGVDFVRA